MIDIYGTKQAVMAFRVRKLSVCVILNSGTVMQIHIYTINDNILSCGMVFMDRRLHGMGIRRNCAKRIRGVHK